MEIMNVIEYCKELEVMHYSHRHLRVGIQSVQSCGHWSKSRETGLSFYLLDLDVVCELRFQTFFGAKQFQ